MAFSSKSSIILDSFRVFIHYSTPSPIIITVFPAPPDIPNLSALAAFLAESDWKPPNLSALAFIKMRNLKKYVVIAF